MKAEVVRSLIIMRRYWFATLTGIIMGYGFLLALVLGFFGGYVPIDKVMSVVENILGFIIGMFAFGIIGLFTSGLQGMARTGQLEQVCMSPHGLVTNFLARSFVSAVTSILSLSIVFTLVALHVGGEFHAPVLPTITLLALTYVNLIGFGFMTGGLVLIFKQTGQIATLLRLGLLLWAVFATEEIRKLPRAAQWVAHALPVTDAAICLKYVMIQGQRAMVENAAGELVPEGPYLSVFSPSYPSFYALILSSVVWTLIGISCFRYMENVSRNKGTLGAY